jgi:hypothetical protein
MKVLAHRYEPTELEGRVRDVSKSTGSAVVSSRDVAPVAALCSCAIGLLRIGIDRSATLLLAVFGIGALVASVLLVPRGQSGTAGVRIGGPGVLLSSRLVAVRINEVDRTNLGHSGTDQHRH